MTTVELLTILALIAGPILAVLVTRIIDRYRMKRDRRLDVFRTLMCTRRTPVSPDHVRALNLVEIEFQSVPPVLDAWEQLFRRFTDRGSRHRDEEIHDGLSDDEKLARNDRYNQRNRQEEDQLLAKLLHAMAKELGYKIEQIDILSRGYYPQGLTDIDVQQSAIRYLFAQMFARKRGLPIEIFNPAQVSAPVQETEKPLPPIVQPAEQEKVDEEPAQQSADPK